MSNQKLTTRSKVELFTSPPSQNTIRERFEVSIDDFIDFNASGNPRKKAKNNKIPVEDFQHQFLIIGFDTEYKTPDFLVSKEDIREGKAKYNVLSYQFHAKYSDGEQWSGICIPESDQTRISIGEFIVFCLGSRPQSVRERKLPLRVYLVGHFLRADVPAFSDFKDQTSYLSSVRGTFSSIDLATPLKIVFDDQKFIEIEIFTRDTMLLTPQSSKSLRELGKLVGVEKVELHEDRKIAKQMISNMDAVRRDQWDLFKNYALTDAEICLKYIEKVINQYHSVTGKEKIPVTLTSIGVDLLIKS